MKVINNYYIIENILYFAHLVDFKTQLSKSGYSKISFIRYHVDSKKMFT